MEWMLIVQAIGIALGSGFVRSFFGWLENAMEDGKISRFELLDLGASISRVGLMAVLIYFGTGLESIESGSIGVLLDLLLSKIGIVKKK